jgi:septum formation protein
MLVLASRSPRRREILSNAGIAHTVRPADIPETVLPGESPRAHVERLAGEKAKAVEAGPGEVVLGADTVVVVDGEILGKPADAADARRMLARLSGREHQVITGICLRRGAETLTASEVTRVRFTSLTPADIDAYIASREPMDKAGAYAIQGLASKFIDRVEGCYFNVVGLPIALVWRRLNEFTYTEIKPNS